MSDQDLQQQPPVPPVEPQEPPVPPAPEPPAPPVEPPAPTAEEQATPEDIAARLGGQSTENRSQQERPEDAPVPQTSAPFDISKLTAEDVQMLASMMKQAPQTLRQKKENPRVLIRRMLMRTEGSPEPTPKYVVDFKTAYLALVYDPVRMTDVETHKIPVKFLGDTTFTDVLYKEFMGADQVPVEVIGHRTDEEPVADGTTRNKETGEIIQLEYTVVHHFYKVKLPEGAPLPEAEIEGKVANA